MNNPQKITINIEHSTYAKIKELSKQYNISIENLINILLYESIFEYELYDIEVITNRK